MNLPRRANAVRNSSRSRFSSRQADEFVAAGLKRQLGGRLAEAEKLYRMALEADPNRVAALNNLGVIAPLEEKAALFRRALKLRPDYVDSHINLAAVLATQGDLDGAVSHYRQALRAQPQRADIHYALGRVFQLRSQFVEAADCFLQAVTLKPDFVAALFSLGCVFALAGLTNGSKQADQMAAKWFRRTLELAPDLQLANFQLAKLLEDDGQFAEALPYRNRVARPLPLETAPAPDHRRTVLIMCTPSAANTPFRNLLPQQFNTLITWQIDYATDEQEESLPPYDIAFNIVGNADWDGLSFARANAFAQRRPGEVLNLPERVTRTRRDLMPELLDGIPDVVVPRVARLSSDEIQASDFAARLDKEGLALPLIVRPFGHQGGVGVILANTLEELAAMSFADAEFYYFIQYYDYKGADGYYRKYRTIFVDRQPYPYHLAISQNWLVHYFSAEMLAEPWKREEERRFLEEPAAALGARAAAAVAAIGQRMDMDYAGIDYSVLPDGRLLIFEGNATMSVYFPDAKDYPYKTKHIQAIIAAFDAMLDRRVEACRRENKE